MNTIERARPNKRIQRWEYKFSKQPIFGNNPIETYYFSLSNLREDYKRYNSISDEEFSNSLVEAAHFACIVSYYKNLSSLKTISDVGIVHELIHLESCRRKKIALLNSYDEELKRVRKYFKKALKI